MMALAMSGLVLVQAQLLRNAWQLKEQAFDRNAQAALSLTVQQLESGDFTEEAVAIMDHTVSPDFDSAEIFFKRFTTDENFPSRTAFIAMDSLEVSSQRLEVFLSGDRNERIHQVVSELLVLEPRPFDQRANLADIDSLLVVNLESVGISVQPSFAVKGSTQDSLIMANVAPATFPEKIAPYQARLFPLDFMPPSFDLYLWFPGRTQFLRSQIWPLALASLVFMVVVLVSFWLNLRLIAEQQRAAASMVDFINNMTHEFKTPISTVHLASEAIAGEEFQDLPESLQRYNSMIRQEVGRMSRHAERILQFAYLEEGDFVADGGVVAMHQVISESCDAFRLAVTSADGQLDLQLAAENDLVAGDGAHLANIVTNLVDNAIKYSPGAPLLRVTSSLRSAWFVLEVADSGLGIAPQDQKRIFERYFRCSTGDRHDVKGFGLGLSYVKLLVAAHKGRLELESQVGNGTTIRVLLPLHQAELKNG